MTTVKAASTPDNTFPAEKQSSPSLDPADVEAHDGSQNGEIDEKVGTKQDQLDMRRMGKEQTLRRNFGFFSIFGFTMILLSTWETQLATLSVNIMTSGEAGMIYLYIGVFVGMIMVILSMAEMAAIAPTAGGQYHWVSEFAPPRAQQFLSYLVGWLSVLGWQSGSASSCFLSGLQIQGLIILNTRGDENTPATYEPKAWHASLITFAIVLFVAVFNTFLARKLPSVEGAVLILHVVGFFAIMIPLLVLGPMSSAKEVFTTFQGGEVWGSQGLSSLVGMLAPVVSLLGADSATHMAEELQDAAKTLPRAMVATAVTNGMMGFGMLLTAVFAMGNFDVISHSSTGFPHMEVFYQATGSYAGATVMSSIIIILGTFGAISNMATASRQMFAFARDGALPFTNWFAAVPGKWDIPLNAIIFTSVVSALLSLINIGSSIAYNSITSIGVNGLLSSYIVSIVCVMIRRWKGDLNMRRTFNLGRVGFVINVIGVGFLIIAYIFCFFPSVPNPSATEMNWGIVVYSGTIIFALIYFYFVGHKMYAGPVTKVMKID